MNASFCDYNLYYLGLNKRAQLEDAMEEKRIKNY
jgi:hypothetical protein